MINKIVKTLEAAVADIADGSTILIGGFGGAGMPSALMGALIAQGAKDLTVVNNNAGNADSGLAALIAAKQVKKIICSFPRQTDSWHFDKAYRAGELELELVPPAQASAHSSRPLRWVPCWPRARKRGASAIAITFSSIRSTPTMR